MSASFSTDDESAELDLRPARVPMRREALFEEAKNLASELPGWRVVRADESALVIVCERVGGALAPTSTVTLRVEGPEGLPSSVLHCVSESRGGLFARDRRNVLEFMTPFHRRVC